VINVNFTPSLSSFELLIKDKDLYTHIRSHIMKDKNEENFKDFSNEGTNPDNRLFEYYVLDTSFKVIFYESRLKIEFYEHRPHHFRNTFIEQFEMLLDENIFGDLKVFRDFEENSWFSILWFPLKTTKHNFMINTSFLVYYSLNNFKDTKPIHNLHDFPVIGVLPLRLDEQTWLAKINKNDFKRFDVEYKICLDQSIANVNEYIFSNTNHTSVDYDYYYKNSFN